MDLEVGELFHGSKGKKFLPLVGVVVAVGAASFFMKKKNSAQQESTPVTENLTDNQKTDIDNKLNDVGGMYNDMLNTFQHNQDLMKNDYLNSINDMNIKYNETNEKLKSSTALNDALSSQIAKNQEVDTQKFSSYDSIVLALKGEVDSLKSKPPTVIYQNTTQTSQGIYAPSVNNPVNSSSINSRVETSTGNTQTKMIDTHGNYVYADSGNVQNLIANAGWRVA